MNEDRLFEMLTELKVGQATTNERLAHYNASLDEHIKRTELLESRQDEFEKYTNKQLEVAILPIKSIKWIAGAAITIGAVVSALKSIIFK
jgi:hypothetical protein